MEQYKVKVDEGLLEFLEEWLEWATGPALGHHSFSRSRGLCSSYGEWLDQRGQAVYIGHLHTAFINSQLCPHYPFGEDTFDSDVQLSSMHMRPARLNWVESIINYNKGIPNESA